EADRQSRADSRSCHAGGARTGWEGGSHRRLVRGGGGWPLDGRPATTLPLPIAPPKMVATVEPDMTRKAAPTKLPPPTSRQAELASAKTDAERAAAELRDAEAALTALKKVVAARAEALRKAEGKVKDLEAGRGESK